MHKWQFVIRLMSLHSSIRAKTWAVTASLVLQLLRVISSKFLSISTMLTQTWIFLWNVMSFLTQPQATIPVLRYTRDSRIQKFYSSLLSSINSKESIKGPNRRSKLVKIRKALQFECQRWRTSCMPNTENSTIRRRMRGRTKWLLSLCKQATQFRFSSGETLKTCQKRNYNPSKSTPLVNCIQYREIA